MKLKTLLIGLMTLFISFQTSASGINVSINIDAALASGINVGKTLDSCVINTLLLCDTYYYPTGEIEREEVFDPFSSDSHWVTYFNINGEPTKTTNYYSFICGAGEVKHLSEYVDGKDLKTTGYYGIRNYENYGEAKHLREYVDGKLLKSTFYYDTGEVRQVNEYVNVPGVTYFNINGEVTGITNRYSFNCGAGEVKQVNEYVDGKKSKATKYYKTGEVSVVEEFVDGKNLKTTGYYGIRSYESDYYGIRNYESGQVKYLREYVDGKLSKSTTYYRTGEVGRVIEYVDVNQYDIWKKELGDIDDALEFDFETGCLCF